MANDDISLLTQAEQLVEKAQNAQSIGGYSISKNTTNIELLQGPLAKVICQRLAALQYLSNEEIDSLKEVQIALQAGEHNNFVERFDAAIRLLQKEAGLKADAWLSSKTFNALQNLFSFEDPKDLQHWTQPSFRNFFNRALYARLNVLGVMPQPATRFFTLPTNRAQQYAELNIAVNKSLSYFSAIVTHLNLRLPAIANKKLALKTLVFDTDGLTQQLAENKTTIAQKLARVVRPAPWEKPENGYPDLNQDNINALSLRFLMSQARIETWLNGFGSKIKDDKSQTVFRPNDSITSNTYGRAFVPGAPKITTTTRIRYGQELERMLHFWSDAQALISGEAGQTVLKIKRNIKADMRKSATKWTFARFALETLDYANKLNQIELKQQDMDPSLLTQHIDDLSHAQLASPAWSEEHSSSLFDGIKRAWRWVVGKVKSVINVLSEGFRLIIRAVKSVAFNGFSLFKKLKLIFSNAVEHVVHKTWWHSNSILILRDTDFDMVTAISPNTNATEIENAIHKIQAQTQSFRASAAIIQLVLVGISKVRKFIVNPVYGIVSALITLVHFDSLLTQEDKEYIELAFAQLPN